MNTNFDNLKDGDEESGAIGSDRQNGQFPRDKFETKSNSDDQEIKAEKISKSSSTGSYRRMVKQRAQGSPIEGEIQPKK